MNLNNILGFTLKSQTVEMKWLLILMFTLKTLCLGHLENRGYMESVHTRIEIFRCTNEWQIVIV